MLLHLIPIVKCSSQRDWIREGCLFALCYCMCPTETADNTQRMNYAGIDDSAQRKEQPGNTVDACAEWLSNRCCDGRGAVYITFHEFRE